MRAITPHLWFDREAKEAAALYVSLFPDSRISSITTLHDTPSGDCDMVSFELARQPFLALNAGPLFRINPSISFILHFDSARDNAALRHLDTAWERLAEGGAVLMPLAEYPFSRRFGWLQDRYGVCWQLILSNSQGEPRPFITPSLMFTGEAAGRAEEAIDFYCAVFHGRRGVTARYPAGMEPEREGTLMFAEFQLLDTRLAAMDTARPHEFFFNEAVSLLIPCRSQQEIDYYWDRLSADPAAEACGWLKDRFGVSWQVQPEMVSEMLSTGTEEQVARLVKAQLVMKKPDLARLQRAFEGK